MTRRVLLRIAVVVLAVSVASCSKGDGRKATFPVSGKVLDGNKPVANASVVFHPAGGGEKPHGKTDAAGNFQLTTYAGNDGAPAGDYKVTVELWVTRRPDEGPTSQLPPKFAKPETSGFAATVTTGPTDLQPFTIKR
jgi:hypothetical protein